MTGVIAARLRAHVLRLRGASIGDKVSLGSRCMVASPHQLTIGFRSSVESDVWFKSESSGASIEIGDHCFIGRLTEIDATGRVSIGNGVLIAPRVFITDHNHNIAREKTIRLQGCSVASVVIEDDVWIGAGVAILPGVNIGQGAVVGAGAVVTKNVPAYEIWAGVPARKIGQR